MEYSRAYKILRMSRAKNETEDYGIPDTNQGKDICSFQITTVTEILLHFGNYMQC